MPPLGGALLSSVSQNAVVTQATSTSSTPDTQFNQVCQTNCCECAEAAHASLAVQAKNRTFTITGGITVLEQVYFAERERAAEEELSHS
jgi:ArsR family metal-binding transcriptional regulator